MSELSKKARAAMKSKAERLGSSKGSTKVDSSTFTPAEDLNADVKTGLRPLSKRAFKKGGKVVDGDKAKARADRKARKAGGRTMGTEIVNRDVKKANEERDGKKHVGGMKAGGRAYQNGGKADPFARDRIGSGTVTKGGKDVVSDTAPEAEDMKRGRRPQPSDLYEPDQIEVIERGYKKGGKAKVLSKAAQAKPRAKKANGGELDDYGPGVSGAAKMMKNASDRAGVPDGLYGAQTVRTAAGSLSPAGAIGKSKAKKGGRIERHDDEKMDRALFKKMMAEHEAMKEDHEDMKKRPARKDGGKVKSKGKGKTNINIIISAGGKDQPGGMMPPPPPPMDGPAGIPVPMPPPGMGPGMPMGGPPPMPMGGPPPMPMPPPGDPRMPRKSGGRAKAMGGGMMPPRFQPAGGGRSGVAGGRPAPRPIPSGPVGGGRSGVAGGRPAPRPIPSGPVGGGMAPPRKDGGRISKVAKSYKDMTSGAGSGEGRLQKTDIAKRKS